MPKPAAVARIAVAVPRDMDLQACSLGQAVPQVKTLREYVDTSEKEVRVLCADCDRDLGRHVAHFDEAHAVVDLDKYLGPAQTRGEPPWRWVVKGPPVRVGRSDHADREHGRRGPRRRIGPGLYPEVFGNRPYLRKRCKCGAKSKRPVDCLGDLLVTFPQDLDRLPELRF